MAMMAWYCLKQKQIHFGNTISMNSVLVQWDGMTHSG